MIEEGGIFFKRGNLFVFFRVQLKSKLCAQPAKTDLKGVDERSDNIIRFLFWVFQPGFDLVDKSIASHGL